MDKTKRLVDLLIEKKYTISFAESCTGGKMAAAIVDVPDASSVLNESFITYANEAKIKYAHVLPETLKQYGAVSEQVALEMAKGIAKENQADVSVGISGIAGPGGGTEQKPVGTVCFGYSIAGETFSETVRFPNEGRNQIRNMCVDHVIDTLIKQLNK